MALQALADQKGRGFDMVGHLEKKVDMGLSS